ncbi:MAG: ATP-binding cassette domain-containing protein [Haemophilus parainfluenzae]
MRDSGEIYLNGELLNRKKSSDIAKQLAILKQLTNINLRLTIEDLVAFGRFSYCKGNLTQTDCALLLIMPLAYMNLDDIRHQHIDNLSGGQRQRAYIAMTHLHKIRIIFCWMNH